MEYRLQFCVILITECVDFETLQAYDVADLLKQYFRELPECLLTNKLSETFISIFTRMWTHFKIKVSNFCLAIQFIRNFSIFYRNVLKIIFWTDVPRQKNA